MYSPFIKAICAAVAGLLAFLQPLAPGADSYEPGVTLEDGAQTYPCVFVHGFAGWGFDDPLTDIMPYWGSFSGELTEYLSSGSCECVNASCGSFSSAWDRACELYAQLTGTTVDYGAAHSEKYGHERYGKTYEKAIVSDWSESNKINIIAHSFGGNTVRLLSCLLESGDAVEREATKDGTVSALFEGGHGGRIYSICTLASPHNGTTLTAALGMNKGSPLLTAAYGVICAMGCSFINDYFDVDLQCFGIDGTWKNFSLDTVKKLADSEDTGVYDLSLEGAKRLNDRIELLDDILYFSYAGCYTKSSAVSENQIPSYLCLSTFTALAMGRYSGEKDGAPLGKEWLRNDGIVNTVSATAPFDEPQTVFSGTPQTGVWQVMPEQYLDHHAFTFGRGMTSSGANELAALIISQMNLVSSTYK